MTRSPGDAGERPAGGGAGGSRHALRVFEFPRVLEVVAAHASSDLGRHHVRGLRPHRAPDRVESSLAAVDETIAFLHRDPEWLPPRIPDVRSAVRRLAVEGAVLEGEALHGISVLLGSSRSARSDLRQDPDAFPRLAGIAEELIREPELQERLERSVDESGAVRDGASGRLRSLRRELRAARSDLTRRLEEFARGLRDRIRVPDASVTVRSGRYCVPIRREGRSEVGGIVHGESGSGQTLFVEPPSAVEPMNRIREKEAEEGREVRRILRELSGRLRPLAPRLSGVLSALVRLDSLYARAMYALSHGGERPEISAEGGRGEIRIVQGYHPLLLAADEPAVPFAVTLASDERVLLVSGPNAGGKTVLLKAVGLLSALSQAGVVPPVGPGTRLPLFGDYFAVIGDEQSIDASLSTFSAQVSLLRRILEESDGSSLVLLDEVGSHTDPAEGAALAASVLLRLAGQAGLTVATTHLGELKSLAGEDARVVNASLEFDPEELRPTYRLRRDRPGRSYALEIAGRLGLPEGVLVEARERLGAGERRLEGLLSELETKEARVTDLEREAERRRGELGRREEELREREERLELREHEIERDARERVEEYLLEAREEVEEAIRELEEEVRERETPGVGERGVDTRGSEPAGESASESAGDPLEEAARRARDRVEEAVRESRRKKPPAERAGRSQAPAADLSPGDRVRVASLGREARVDRVGEEEAVVEAGSVRITLPLEELERVEEGAGPAGRPDRESVGSHRDAPSRPRVDLEAESEVHLRGLRVDEVEGALLPKLDAAVVADLPRFRIVHGKGTGALRQKVRELLRADSRVAAFRSAPPAEGGSGVTVVELA